MVDTISALYHASEHQHRTLTFVARYTTSRVRLATPEGIESERLHLEKAMKRYGPTSRDCHGLAPVICRRNA